MLNALNAILAVAPSDQKDLTQKALKLSEEVGEVSRAVLCVTGAHGTAHRGQTEAELLEEIADTILVAVSMLSQMQTRPTLGDLAAAILRKIPNWRKTLGLPDLR